MVDERRRLGDFLDMWLSDVVKPNREYPTWNGYEQRVRLHIKPTLGHVPLARLTAADVHRLLNDKRAEGLSPRSVQYVHATLRAALGVAERWGYVARNVATLVKSVNLERHEVRPFTPEEARRLLAAAEQDRLGALFAVALSVGLRPGEALALAWEDVDLDGQPPTVRVRRSIRCEAGRGLVLTDKPKTQRSRRTIPLPVVCSRALRRHRKKQTEERLAAGEWWQDSGLVFTTGQGAPLDERNVIRHFDRLQERAGVERHRLYDARHTAATLLLAQGVPARVVMETLGHSSFQLTMDTYTHVMPVLMSEAADAMDRALGSQSTCQSKGPTAEGEKT